MREPYTNYVTHQCFLSARSLYLAVWNVTDGIHGIEALGPWLHNIQVWYFCLCTIHVYATFPLAYNCISTVLINLNSFGYVQFDVINT